MAASFLNRHEAYQTLIAILNACGINHRIEESKHLRVLWEAHGHKRMYVLGKSPSDWRVTKKVACDIRRMLKQDGVTVLQGV